MRAPDHHWGRTSLALVGTLPASLLAGVVITKWLPDAGTGYAFALGWHLPYVIWPSLMMAIMCTPSWRVALAWVLGLTAALLVFAYL